MSEARVCSRSQGQPSSPLRRVITSRRESKRVPGESAMSSTGERYAHYTQGEIQAPSLLASRLVPPPLGVVGSERCLPRTRPKKGLPSEIAGAGPPSPKPLILLSAPPPPP